MYTIGVTTIRRWVVESLAFQYESYVVDPSTGKLATVLHIIAARGSLIVKILPCGMDGIAGSRRANMDTPVYLCDSAMDLSGKTVDELGDMVVAADTSYKSWMLRSVDDLRTPADTEAAAPIHCG